MQNTRKSKEDALVKKKRSILLRLAVLAAVVWAAVTITQLRLDIADAETKRSAVQLEIDRQKRENALVSELLNSSSDIDAIAEAARDELGYVSANEQIFYDVSN